MVDWIEKYLAKRFEEHNTELYMLEKKLSEYRGLSNERRVEVEESYYKFVKSLKLKGLECFMNAELPGRRKLGGVRLFSDGLEKVVFPGVLDDWEIYEKTSTWNIDVSKFISPPSSLLLKATAEILTAYTYNDGYIRFIGKNPNILNLPFGRLVFYCTFSETYYGNYYRRAEYLKLYFRVQNPVGSDLSTITGYVINFDCVLGEFNVLGNVFTDSSFDRYSWNHYRITWWVDPNWDALVVRVEREVSGSWVQIGNDVLDPTNQYYNSSINRVGFEAYEYGYGTAPTSGVLYSWIDNVEVWAP